MSVFVLVHGSWHAAWCWYKIVPRLQQAGHTAIALDLPGHGRNPAALHRITLHDYAEAIGAVLRAQPEPVVLVGHSRGGIAISLAAERWPEKIGKLVYLAAFLVPSGESVLALARHDRDSLVAANLEINRDEGWDWLRPGIWREALYADCPEDDMALARTLLTPEPLAPSATPMPLSDANFGRVARAYIELLQDRAVSPALQRSIQAPLLAQWTLHAALPCQQVLTMNTSHSAYFSAPDALTANLVALAR
jgi:pimeloyl-ACP methyl ester carboxylesterase